MITYKLVIYERNEKPQATIIDYLELNEAIEKAEQLTSVYGVIVDIVKIEETLVGRYENRR